MLTIPNEWKSKRQMIVEVYIFETKNVNEIAKKLGYESPSFPRLVIHEYREYLKEQIKHAPLLQAQ